MTDPESSSGLSTSVIIPLFNSAALLAPCHTALVAVLDRLPGESEIIFVDDGSRDATLELACRLQAQDARVRVIELATNYGQHAAIMAGLERVRYHHIVTLDVDLQCDPQDIPRMLAALADGFDFVSGVRRARSDAGWRRLFSHLANALVGRLSGVPLRDAGCPLNALTSELARELCRHGELRRFAKPLAARLARRVAEVEIEVRPAGKHPSSYSPTALVNLFMDFLVPVSGWLFAWAFMGFAALAAVLGLASVIATAVCIGAGRPLWLPLVTAALCALALIGTMAALAGEITHRTWRQTAGIPMYVVRRLHEPRASDG